MESVKDEGEAMQQSQRKTRKEKWSDVTGLMDVDLKGRDVYKPCCLETLTESGKEYPSRRERK